METFDRDRESFLNTTLDDYADKAVQMCSIIRKPFMLIASDVISHFPQVSCPTPTFPCTSAPSVDLTISSVT